MSADDTAGTHGTDGTDVHDLIAAYALDAVDDVERRTVERLVARDARAAQELAELRATAALLGAARSTPPPPALRGDVLGAIARTPQAAAAAGVVGPGPADAGRVVTGRSTRHADRAPAGPARRPGRTTTWLAVAATALAAAAIPSALAVQQAQQTQRVEARAQAVTDLLADPGSVVVRSQVAGGGTAVGVLSDERALFTATGLAEPAEGREYQLWVLRDGEALSQGVVPDDGGRVEVISEDYRSGDGLAVTVEPAGGSEQPTTEPVVVLQPAQA
ncbi:anti-sigma factor [uncultured Cellulomonas sp.]|uniref:anti-sigma factor n=1 Tax=uncultured Cellulomonas sp. TaxID=189682 RepID=UPI00260B776E|nr:anti-sigma factor [uncultured Cellulomonas sp.]